MRDLFQEAYLIARKVARVHSAKWSSALRSAGVDRQDLEADCVAEVWGKLKRFDSTRSSLPTFVERVVATRTTSFLRRCRTAKRTPHDASAVAAFRVPIGLEIDIRVDVHRALVTLDCADRKVARMLLHWTPSEIAKMVGINRAAVYRSKERIRRALLDAGF